MADTSDVQMAYVIDTDASAALPIAAAPGNTAWKRINFVSHDLVPQSDTVRSRVIRPDAANQDARRFSGGWAGTLACELARDPELEDLMAYALRGAWASDVLKAGAAKTEVAFEERVVEGATPFYNRYRGGVIGGFALEVGTDGMADIRFPVSGRTIEDGTAALANSAYTAAGAAPVLAGVDFTALTLSGWTNQMDVDSITIDLTNNTRSDRKLGSADPRAVNYGKRDVTIDFRAFFEDNEALQKFKANATTAAAFGFTAPGGTAGFDFAFDRCRITSYGKPIPGENQTIMVSMSMVATYDATNGTDFRITRRA